MKRRSLLAALFAAPAVAQAAAASKAPKPSDANIGEYCATGRFRVTMEEPPIGRSGTVNAGIRHSQNGKMTINLNNGTIAIRS
jgi:hypothetical protein